MVVAAGEDGKTVEMECDRMPFCRKCVDANSRENDTNRVIDSLVEILTNSRKKVSHRWR